MPRNEIVIGVPAQPTAEVTDPFGIEALARFMWGLIVIIVIFMVLGIIFIVLKELKIT